MAQTRLASFVEAWGNVIIGYSINFVANIIILPFFFGVHISLAQNILLGGIYTIISVVRSYFLRRLFNWIRWGNN